MVLSIFHQPPRLCSDRLLANGINPLRCEENTIAVEIIMLGTGTVLPLCGRASPAIAVHLRGRLFCLDFGPGTLRQMARVGLPFYRLAGVFLTHFHPDHTADVVPLLFAMRHPSIMAMQPSFILGGPAGLGDFLDKLRAAYGRWVQPPTGCMTQVEMAAAAGEKLGLGGASLTAGPTRHTPHSLAYRIDTEEGKCVVYSGDTGLCPEIIALAHKADILILDCALPDQAPVEGHLTPSSAGRLAELAGAKRLVLTHFYPQCLRTDIAASCRRFFTGELTLASDLLRITL